MITAVEKRKQKREMRSVGRAGSSGGGAPSKEEMLKQETSGGERRSCMQIWGRSVQTEGAAQAEDRGPPGVGAWQGMVKEQTARRGGSRGIMSGAAGQGEWEMRAES